MKSPTNYILLLIAAGTLVASCKKSDKFDSTKTTQTDFIGTWRGQISTFRHNQIEEYSGDLVIYSSPSGQTLFGLFSMQEVNIVEMVQFNSGTFYFNLLCNSPDDPLCKNWSLAGLAQLVDEGRMQLYISGNECGPVGDQYADFSGVLTLISPIPDSSYLYTFGRAGNEWDYRIRLVNNDSCTVQYILSAGQEINVYQVQDLNSCGWQPPSVNYFWYVTPLYFQYLQDYSPLSVVASFPIGARPNYTYRQVYNGDTTYVTLINPSEEVVVPAGTFDCRRFLVTANIHSTSVHIASGYYLLNNQAGIVKYINPNPLTMTDVNTQELVSKNF